MKEFNQARVVNSVNERDLRLPGPDQRLWTGIKIPAPRRGLLERVGTGIVGTIGYVVLRTGVSTDVSRDIV